MPSAADRRAKTGKKMKEQAKLALARKDSMMADASQGVIAPIVEIPHVFVDPNNNNAPDASQGAITTPVEALIGEIGKKTFKSIAAVFEYWADQPMEEDSIYNAADPNSSYHAEWLRHQRAFRKKDMKEYAPTSVPYNLQVAKENGIDVSSHLEEPASKNSRARDCLYWSLGTCRNGDDCRFFHDPTKAPKSGVVQSNVCWRWKKSMCFKTAADCPYDHFE
ncbi:hypothetical protein P171DRAFT_246776 [Karstenula rhodostoma CBS 690.94]|uniref:C3H1-type domain-containing protein n=1 Tax=Karstenula rhodostoma CBS 690.94 TaxID=1392251 RepID=A0A9P4PNE7_9PLEO|nr:hypothetical protein P171DRAFT_246776 [Karstenula rhodostoma CBS 690.94]